MEKRLFCTQEVVGSNPIRSTVLQSSESEYEMSQVERAILVVVGIGTIIIGATTSWDYGVALCFVGGLIAGWNMAGFIEEQ